MSLKKFLIFAYLLLYTNIAYADSIVEPTCPPPPTTSGIVKNVPSGCFDIYVLAMLWNPEYCRTVDYYDCTDLQNQYVATHFGVHGLWPQYSNNSSYPADCLHSPGGENFDKNKLTKDTWNKYLQLVPINGSNLASHEWHKHGTCGGLTQEDYFSKTINKIMEINNATTDFAQYIGKSISYSELTTLFGGKDKVILHCDYDKTHDQHYLSSVITFWNKNLDEQLNNPGLTGTCKHDKLIYIPKI